MMLLKHQNAPNTPKNTGKPPITIKYELLRIKLITNLSVRKFIGIFGGYAAVKKRRNPHQDHIPSCG